MGMFDSFFLKTKCPYCKEVAVREFQTKQLNRVMDAWDEGDTFVSGGIKIFSGLIESVLGGCRSKKCNDWQIKRDGYKSGFGKHFYCDVVIEDSKVKGATNIRKKEYQRSKGQLT